MLNTYIKFVKTFKIKKNKTYFYSYNTHIIVIYYLIFIFYYYQGVGYSSSETEVDEENMIEPMVNTAQNTNCLYLFVLFFLL